MLLIAGLLLSVAIAQAQGYRLEKDRVVIEGADWQEWSVTSGTVQVSAAGVQPRFIRDQTNAALEAPEFGGGIWNAGTRLEPASRIIDGQEDTFWEPDPAAPLDDWWVEIDLGHLVWTRQVVVKFVAEDGANPALQFKLRTSKGPATVFQRTVLDYKVAGRSQETHRAPDLFVFDLKPSEIADPGFPGDPIRFLQILFTARDDGQTEEVSEAHWHALPVEERGAILYVRRQASGDLQPVDRAAYEAIDDPARKGPIRYYRRYRVRLTEVEVWSMGDNLSLGVLDRGGEITASGDSHEDANLVDGDYTTFGFIRTAIRPSEEMPSLDRSLFFDLGAVYWVNRVLMLFEIANGGLSNYILALSDGRRQADGNLIYTRVAARGQGGVQDENPNRFILFQSNPFPLTRAQYLKVDYQMRIETAQMVSMGTRLRELELYGTGFLPQVTLTSGLIELGAAPRVLSTLDWDAQVPPGTKLQLRTRTGDQLVPQVHYFNSSGGEVTRERYYHLVSFQRGDSLITFMPGEDWSLWSHEYPFSGAEITSPSPRRYAMVQATLRSDDPNQAVLLRRLSLHLKTILATQVVGEILPRVVPHIGQAQPLTLFLRPDFQVGHAGFDQVLVEIPPSARVELVEVVVGKDEDVAAGGGRVYQAAELRHVPTGPDSLWVRHPEPITPPAQEVVALRLSGVFYLASNAFVVRVGLGDGAEHIWQLVDAGDATAQGRGRHLKVFTPLDRDFLGAVVVNPNPFTPNGDGINDAVEFTVPVFKVLGPKVLYLEVYRLDGRRVQRVEQAVGQAAGPHRLVWDGRDRNGRLAPPGLYLCRVGLDIDAEDVDPPQVTQLVASVY